MFRLRKPTLQDHEHIEVTISNRTVVRVLVMVMLSLIALAAVKVAAHAFVLIFIAFFFALALNAPVHWVASRLPGKRKGNRSIATAVSAVVIVLVLGLFLASIVPPIIRETNSFIRNAPQLIKNLRDPGSESGKFIAKYKLERQIDDVGNQLASKLKNASGLAVSTVSQIGSSLFATLTILAMTVMMLTEGPHWVNLSMRLVPKRKQEDVERITRDMYKVVKGYVNGQVTLAALAAVLIVPALFILHIQYPFALMFIIFICGLIPMIGHTIGAAIVTIVALFSSPVSAVIILAYYILYQQIENYAIQPRIQANSTNMSPLLVFVSVVIGVSFSGLLGGLVAIPIMGCIRILTLYWLEKREMLPEGSKAQKDLKRVQASA